MKLLNSQKNTLFDSIQEKGLSPSQFELIEVYSITMPSNKAIKVRYKKSEYYFLFDHYVSTYQENAFYLTVSPAYDKFSESHHSSNWESSLYWFKNWLDNLFREINSPDKWKRLQDEVNNISINNKNDEDKFSAEEYEDLKQKVLVVKNSLSTLQMMPAQIAAINAKLDHLTEMAVQMNKFDWKSLFVGSIMSVVIQLEVTKENANALWSLIKQVFSNYFLP
jgi:hypothetical protein